MRILPVPLVEGVNSSILDMYNVRNRTYRQKRALVVIKNSKSPSSSFYIRLLSPLLSIKMPFDVVDGDVAFEEFDMSRYSVCIVQRVALSNVKAREYLILNVKRNNIPLIVDIDDCFFDVSKSHIEYKELALRSEVLDSLIESSDAVIFSTNYLKNEYLNRLDISTEKCYVIENALDKKIWTSRRKKSVATVIKNKDQKTHFIYQGTPTHDKDFEMIFSAFDEVYRIRGDVFEVSIVGATTKNQSSKWLNRIEVKHMIYPEFARWFSDIAQDYHAGVAPLVDNGFNRSKSDVKFLDYLISGLFPIGSDIGVYDDPGMNNYSLRVPNNHSDWVKAIGDTIDMFEKNNYDRKKSVDYVVKNREVSGECKKNIKAVLEGVGL